MDEACTGCQTRWAQLPIGPVDQIVHASAIFASVADQWVQLLYELGSRVSNAEPKWPGQRAFFLFWNIGFQHPEDVYWYSRPAFVWHFLLGPRSSLLLKERRPDIIEVLLLASGWREAEVRKGIAQALGKSFDILHSSKNLCAIEELWRKTSIAQLS